MNHPNSCQPFREAIAAYVLGELAGDQIDGLKSHLQGLWLR